MKTLKIGDEVVRTKGDYVVGRTGLVVAIDELKNRAQVSWYSELKTWVSFSSLALTSIPYKIIPEGEMRKDRAGFIRYTPPKYVTI